MNVFRSLLARRSARNATKLIAVLALFGLLAVMMNFSSEMVLSHVVTRGPVRAEVMGRGTLEPRIKTTISPRIQERLAEILVDQNDLVKAGQLLARLDDAELTQQVEVAQATLAAAQATAERVRVDEARAQVVEKQARLAHQRIADLLTTRISSQAEFDKAVEQLRLAESDLQRAQAAIVEARQQVLMAEKSLAYQEERLKFTRILSPYDGLVTRRDRDPGGVVVPGSSILQLISTQEIWVSAWIDETAAAELRSGQPARVVFRSQPDQAYAGEVARLARETDRETREFLVDVRVQHLPPNWTIGQRADVFIETGRKPEAVSLPSAMIHWQGPKSGVFVNEKGRARWREVKLGFRGGEQVEIVQGIAVGETVVRSASPKLNLKEGQRIRQP